MVKVEWETDDQSDYTVLSDLICDWCGDSVDELYEYEGEQICSCCLLNNYNRIDFDNYSDYVEKED